MAEVMRSRPTVFATTVSIERLVSKLKVDCVFERKKSVYLASRASDAPILREECEARKAAGIEIEIGTSLK
jgi:hypothetical protein